MDINPYASPKTQSEPQIQAMLVETEAWRFGDLLIVCHNAVLPPRCVKCNAPADLPLKRMRLTWYPRLAYLGLILGLLPFLLIVLVTQKKLTLDVGICDDHRHRRTLGIVVGWLGAILGVALAIVAAVAESGWAFLIAVVLFFGSLIVCAFMSRIVWPKRIEKRFGKIKGVCPEFLDMLPEAPL